MSFAGNRSWLELKHGGAPRYAFACGGHDSDWDYVSESLDTAASYNRGYQFSSADQPIHLRNNLGGMDEDEKPSTDVWYPHQNPSGAIQESDSEMSDSHSTDEMDMDTSDNTSMEIESQQQVHLTNSKKRSAETFEFSMNTGMDNYERQKRVDWTTRAKRVRVGA